MNYQKPEVNVISLEIKENVSNMGVGSNPFGGGGDDE